MTFAPSWPARATLDEHALLERVAASVHARVGLLPRHLIVDYYVSLKANRFVVLTGPERCGKTVFAEAVAAALIDLRGAQYVHIPGARWPERTGTPAMYSVLQERYSALRLLDVLYEASQPTHAGRLYVVCMTRLHPDELHYYLAELLRVDGEQTRLNLPGFPPEHQPLVPPNVLIIATVNTSDWGRGLDPGALRHAGLIAYQPPQPEAAVRTLPTVTVPPPPGLQRLWLGWALRGAAVRERLDAALPPNTLRTLEPPPDIGRRIWRAGIGMDGRTYAAIESYVANSFAADARGLFDALNPVRNAQIALEAQISQRLLWQVVP